ncbi:MAG: restriction endonuclease subunit S [Prevotella sp.]|nr:restriction endonuclease subunit S [Prevotella sp.]MDY4218125.1 restriction endonuclease subunit S [Prevotella sp.]
MIVALGEVCDFQNGFAFKSSLFKEEGLPIVRITNINGRSIDLKDVKYFNPNDYKSGNPLNYNINKGDILIAMSGATTGKIGYYDIETKAYLNQRVGKFIPNYKILNNRFLYHFLLTKSEFLYHLAGGGAQPNLSSFLIKEKILIPLPPLAEQERIVSILDKFDTLTNSISEGLPKEIELRRKQYEYYRNELLSFRA